MGTTTVTGDILSGGYSFDTFENVSRLVNGHPEYADSGSTFMAVANQLDENTITMTLIGGGTFRLNNVQLAEALSPLRNQAENATSVLITGNIFGGGTVSTTVILDGVNDGVGGAADFQLATFNASWDNLTSVVFDGVGDGVSGTFSRFAIDNITVNIPEPSSLALAGIGLLVLTGRKLARKR